MVKWEDYERAFAQAAADAGHDEAYVRRCMTYAEPLFRKGLPPIYDQVHLCGLVGYSTNYVFAAANATEGVI